jgi:hypothetical protein
MQLLPICSGVPGGRIETIVKYIIGATEKLLEHKMNLNLDQT